MTFRITSIALALVALVALAGCTSDQGAIPESAVATAAFDLADYDAGLGRRFYLQCQACHSLAENEPHKTGPNLWGVFGRQAGQLEGFVYSEAFANADVLWTAESLDRFLIKPDDVVPGTTMIFPGIADEANRRHLLTYLQQATQATGK